MKSSIRISGSAGKSPKAREIAHCKDNMRSFLLGYRDWMEEALRREKLSLPQLRMLHAVEQGDDESAAAIARLCQVTPQTLQAMLERAVREQWIVRRAAKRNLRILTATLTPTGVAILERGKALADEVGAQIWSGVSVSALRQVNAVMMRGLWNLQQIAADQHNPVRRPAAKRASAGGKHLSHSEPSRR